MKKLIIVLILFTIYLFSTDHLVETQNSVKDRIKFDIIKIKKFIEDSNLTDKSDLVNQLETISTETDSLTYPLVLDGFKAILPFDTSLHKEVFSIYSKLLNLYMSNNLLVWHTEKNKKLDLYEIPTNNLTSLNIKMMRNEYRYETFNISNGSLQPQEVNLSVTNIPSHTDIKLFRGEFVDGRRIDSAFSRTWYKRLPGGEDNRGGTDALVELTAPYQIVVPSGTTKQITILIKTDNTVAGNYPININLSANDISSDTIRVNLVVSNMKLSKLDYSLTMYDYIADKRYAVSENNIEALINTFNSHYADMPKVILALPDRGSWDEDGKFIGVYDFSKLDNVIDLFPNTKGYVASLSIGSSYTLKEVNFFAPEWEKAMGTWMKALSKHMIERGKNPSQLIVSVVHEPRTLDKINKGLKFAKAIKKYAPEITTTATVYAKAGYSTEMGQELIDNLDIIIIARHHFYGNTSEPNRLTSEEKTFYSNLQNSSNWKKELWFYGTIFSSSHSAEDRLLHVTRDFYNNANGSSYWSLTDNAKNPNGWNMYPNYRPGRLKTRYTPLYITDNSVTTSRQWEAIREGLENNKYAIMLRNIVKRLEREGDIFSASKRDEINNALNIVPLTASEVETKRVKILSLLEELSTEGESNTYRLKIKNGNSDTMWNQEGDNIQITAVAPTKNHLFQTWYSTSGVLADANSSSTIFTMPDSFTSVTASFKYIGDEDYDGDGIANDTDSDDDDDGVDDEFDAFPFNPLETIDTDKDGIGNNSDLDDDDDGFSDIEELANGTDPLDKNDYNGTTRILKLNPFPSFGVVNVGEEKVQTLTIKNEGNSPLTISKLIYLHPSNRNDFTFKPWSGEIDVGASKSVDITYKPTTNKNIRASLYIRSNKTSGNFTQALMGGEATEEDPIDEPTDCTRIFKFQTQTGPSFNEGETKSITIANRGTCALTIKRVRFHQKIKKSFSVSKSITPQVIAPNDSLDINITYNPNPTEPYHKGLVYFDSDKTNPIDRSLLLKGN